MLADKLMLSHPAPSPFLQSSAAYSTLQAKREAEAWKVPGMTLSTTAKGHIEKHNEQHQPEPLEGFKPIHQGSQLM